MEGHGYLKSKIEAHETETLASRVSDLSLSEDTQSPNFESQPVINFSFFLTFFLLNRGLLVFDFNIHFVLVFFFF